MWSELDGGRWGDAGKVEMKRVDLPRAVHLTTTAPASPSAATTHHFNFQLLTVFTSFSRKKTAEDILENSHENYDGPSRHWPWLWLGKTLFCSPVESYVWIVTKSVAITSAWADPWALRALPQAASWLDTRSGKILKKCEWRGRALVTREREPGTAGPWLPGPGRENWLEERGWWW